LSGEQFDAAIRKLQDLGMIELRKGEEPSLEIKDHGANWLMANFHWVPGDRHVLKANSDDWIMTSLDGSASSVGND